MRRFDSWSQRGSQGEWEIKGEEKKWPLSPPSARTGRRRGRNIEMFNRGQPSCCSNVDETEGGQSPSLLTWQSVLVASYSIYMWAFNSYAAPSIPWNKRCLPLRTVNMRALGISPWSIVRGTGHLYPPLCTLWEAASWFGLWCSSLRCCLSWCFISNDFATSSSIRSWQKGDRPDNGDVEPCSNQPKKETEGGQVARPTFFPPKAPRKGPSKELVQYWPPTW